MVKFKQFIQKNKKIIQVYIAIWITLTIIVFAVYTSSSNNSIKKVPDEVYKKILESYRNDSKDTIIDITEIKNITRNLTIS